MSQRQIQWASQHDWFVSAANGAVLVTCPFLIGTTVGHEVRTFRSFADLRTWAGY